MLPSTRFLLGLAAGTCAALTACGRAGDLDGGPGGASSEPTSGGRVGGTKATGGSGAHPGGASAANAGGNISGGVDGAAGGRALRSGGAANGGAGVGGSATNGGAPSTGGAATNGGAPSTGGALGVGGSDAYPATFQTVADLVLLECGKSICHGGGVRPRMRWEGDQDSASLYTTLTTAKAPRCGNVPLVTPGDPDMSGFWLLLKPDAGGCADLDDSGLSSRMPPGCNPDPEYGNCLPSEQIEAVRRWIADGALKP